MKDMIYMIDIRNMLQEKHVILLYFIHILSIYNKM